jgi:hypothetical protein
MLGLAALLVFFSIVIFGYGLAGALGARQTAQDALRTRLHTMAGRGEEVSAAGLFKDQRL